MQMTEPDESSFQKWAAALAMLSAPVAYVQQWFAWTAINYDPTAFGDPGTLIKLGPQSATLFWWAWRIDIFGYYLLILPAVLFLWYWLRPKRPLLVTLLTLGGVLYVVLGALGAAVNAVVWPEFIRDYATAGPQERAVLEPVFRAFAGTVAEGTWGILNRIVSATWWIGIGVLLRSERRGLGWFTIVLGAVTAIAAAGNAFSVMPLLGLGTVGYLFLAPLWALWLGIVLWREPAGPDAIETRDSSPAGTEE